MSPRVLQQRSADRPDDLSHIHRTTTCTFFVLTLSLYQVYLQSGIISNKALSLCSFAAFPTTMLATSRGPSAQRRLARAGNVLATPTSRVGFHPLPRNLSTFITHHKVCFKSVFERWSAIPSISVYPNAFPRLLTVPKSQAVPRAAIWGALSHALLW